MGLPRRSIIVCSLFLVIVLLVSPVHAQGQLTQSTTQQFSYCMFKDTSAPEGQAYIGGRNPMGPEQCVSYCTELRGNNPWGPQYGQCRMYISPEFIRDYIVLPLSCDLPCVDSDGGLDYYIQGTVQKPGEDIGTDYCQDSVNLIEHDCGYGDVTTTNGIIAASPNNIRVTSNSCDDYGCKDGACLRSTPSMTQTGPTPPTPLSRYAGISCNFGYTEFMGSEYSCKSEKAWQVIGNRICMGRCNDLTGDCRATIDIGPFNDKQGNDVSTCNEEIAPSTCMDLDGGINFEVAGLYEGFTNINNQILYLITQRDNCLGYLHNSVLEGYCNGDFLEGLSHECPYGCQDGACLQEQMSITLENYPNMFITNGKFNGVVVVGDFATAEQLIASSDIRSGLQSVSTALVASEVADLWSVNSISIGNTCINAITSILEGGPLDCTQGLEPGVGIIKIINFQPETEHFSLIVSGYSDQDIRNAAQVLANYGHYKDQLKGMIVEVRNINNQLSVASPSEKPQPTQSSKCHDLDGGGDDQYSTKSEVVYDDAETLKVVYTCVRDSSMPFEDEEGNLLNEGYCDPKYD